MVKEYINAKGYKIRASEKAYRLLYKKSGFVPVEDAMSSGLTAAAASTENAAPAGDMTENTTAQTAGKANKGKTKSSASKPRKAAPADQKDLEETDRDANGQDGQEETDAAATDQGEAEQPEGK